ncbi:MAG: hypothetical protein D6723_14825 [Acidobacteria bacterium]|nr:MAG: hypothetical protein D6723_14825 [Acidobacteriota bacterium]
MIDMVMLAFDSPLSVGRTTGPLPSRPVLDEAGSNACWQPCCPANDSSSHGDKRELSLRC